MSQAASIRSNSFSLFFSSAIRLLVNFLIFAGIARLYGPVEFGQFATASVVSNLFLLLADFGFDALLATEVARERSQAPRIVREFLSLKIITAIFASICMLCVPFFSHFSNSTTILIYIFSLNVALSSLINFFSALFRGFEKMKYEAQISFTMNTLSLFCLIPIAWFHYPLYVYATVYILTRVLGLIFAVRIANSLLQKHWFEFSLEAWRKAKRQVMVFGIYLLSGALYFQLDTLLLAYWKGDREVGIYQSVFKIILLVLVIPDIAVGTMLPTLSRLHQYHSDEWIWVGRLLYKTLFFAGMLLSMILFVYAEQIVYLIYGNLVFADAIPVLRIFAVVAFTRFTAEPFGLILTTSKRQEIRMWIGIFAVIANISINAYMIPKYGPIGAALVSLITNILVGIGYITATKPFIGSWVIDFKTVIPFFIMIIISYILSNIPVGQIYYMGLIGVAFCGGVIYLIGFTQDERTRLLSLIGTLT